MRCDTALWLGRSVPVPSVAAAADAEIAWGGEARRQRVCRYLEYLVSSWNFQQKEVMGYRDGIPLTVLFVSELVRILNGWKERRQDGRKKSK